MQASSWQVGASYLRAQGAAMQALGFAPRVLAAVTPETRAALEHPHARSWWPGEVLVNTVCALGGEAARTVAVRASHDGMGPLVKPLTSVLLALTKSPAQALLARLDTFVGAGVKGVTARFTPTPGAPAGAVTFTFPQPVPPEVATVWLGLFDVGFGLAREGRVVRETVEPTVHRYEVAW